MENLLEILHKGGFSLVVRNNGLTESFTKRGVSDLYRLLRERPEFLHGAEVADKVVGKTAAALMILGGVRKLQTFTVSRLALDLLQEHHVGVYFEKEVPHIINRSQTGWCPLESRCKDLKTPQECLNALVDFINEEKKRIRER